MRLEKVRIKGFRNFDDTEVIFQKKTLIIGANDVGKSNLLYALRILFDKTIASVYKGIHIKTTKNGLPTY